MADIPTLVLVGASRGLGLALVEEHLERGWRVIATERAASAKLHALACERLEIERLDVADHDQIRALRRRLDGRPVDLLFVNAGVSNGPAERVGAVTDADFARIMGVNALGPMRVIEAMADLVPPRGQIAVMSSGLGSVADNEAGGWEVYRASKAALNTLVRSFAARSPGDPRSYTLIAPGWVRTDMGGPNAHLSVEESIPGVADVLAARAGQGGVRYLDYKGHAVRW